MAVVVMTAFLMGCTTQTVTVIPTTPPQATSDPQPTFNAVQTQAAQTVIANLTKNAPTATPVKLTNTVAPSATSAPTSTPTSAPTSTPTVALTATLAATVAPTLTPTQAVKLSTLTPTLSTYNCANLSQAPLNTDVMPPYADFDGVWVVQNTGSQLWTNADLDILYLSGTRLQKRADVNEVPFTVSVSHNEQYTVRVDMKAPAVPGVYNTMWAIMKGSRAICNLGLTITVK